MAIHNNKNLLPNINVALVIIVSMMTCMTNAKQAKTDVSGQSQGFNSVASIVEYQVPLPNHYLAGITSGPDGALWFTGGQTNSGNYVGRITTAGNISEYPVCTFPEISGQSIEDQMPPLEPQTLCLEGKSKRIIEHVREEHCRCMPELKAR